MPSLRSQAILIAVCTALSAYLLYQSTIPMTEERYVALACEHPHGCYPEMAYLFYGLFVGAMAAFAAVILIATLIGRSIAKLFHRRTKSSNELS